jgi:peptidoglycan/xylan/chitin deacetylase (PgdA/CDA1 family)
VYLTFDDGPHPRHTPAILDVLADRGFRATFFVLGRNVRRAGTAMLERARAAGHRIGNHAFSHRDLTTIPEAQVHREIARTESLIADVLGPGRLFRPPYGAWNGAVARVVEDLGYHHVSWNVDTRDWNPEYQPDEWVRFAFDQIRGRERSVVLAHDIHRTTADHLADLLRLIEGIGGVICDGPPAP